MSFVTQFVDCARHNAAVDTNVQTEVIGTLPLRVIDTTGGEIDCNYSVSNIVSYYDNVYCSKQNHCTVVFAIEARAGLVQEINVVTPPHTGYTSPVQHIAVFVAMVKEGIAQRVEEYFAQSPVQHLFTANKQRPSLDTAMHTPGHCELENWALFSRELAPRSDDEVSDACMARYHLCYPNYKPDANNCGLVLDVGGRERVRSVTIRSGSGELCPSMDACGTLCNNSPITGCSEMVTAVPPSKWRRTGSLEPLALVTIPRSSQYRHVRIRLDHAICARYLAVRFSNSAVHGNSNVDIESFSVRGVVDPGAATATMV
ncbi:hypothetical protein D0Z00_000392 [Geotrichum galactomycetum]|uniref:Uncharacterized protein n=1 Tax=Geotrichum galactomycetum TaxID=27317 RepID=A0ACB6V9Y8_9ASCO|nr:hypothetical protein D0Z00_000392 [Geotrichum candidum]